MNENKYKISIKTRADASPEEVKHQLEVGRRQVGNELYKILYSQKLPAVVDIKEVPIPFSKGSSNYLPENELLIEITVTPIRVVPYTNLESAKYRVHLENGIWRNFLKFFSRVIGFTMFTQQINKTQKEK